VPKIGDALGTGESSALKWMAMRACLPLFPHKRSLVARTEKQIVIQVALALAQRAERPTDCTQVRNRAKLGDLIGQTVVRLRALVTPGSPLSPN